MTIQLTQQIRIAGVPQSIGTQLSLEAGLEGELVTRNVAIKVGSYSGITEADTTRHAAEHGAMGNINSRPQTAVLFGDSGIAHGLVTIIPAPGLCTNGAGLCGYGASSVFFTDVGAQIQVGNASPSEWNGIYTVSGIQSGAATVNIANISAHTDGSVKITTVAAHGLTAGKISAIASVTGTGAVSTAVSGHCHFVASVIDANNYTLVGLSFSGAYTSGGTSQLAYAVTWASTMGYSQAVSYNGVSNIAFSNGLHRLTHRSWWAVMQSVLKNPFTVVNFSAVDNQATDAMVARVQSAVIGYKPGWCFCHFGANDLLVEAYTPEVAAANAQSLIRTIQAANIKCFYLSYNPFDSRRSGFAAQNILGRRFDRLMREWCLANGVLFYSEWRELCDPAAADGSARANVLTTDGTHHSKLGAQIVGRGVAGIVGPYVTGFDSLLPVSQIDTHASDALNNQYFSNPILATATGGTVSAGGTGTAPAGVTVSRVGTGTFVVSVVARTVAADGDAMGNNVVVVWTPAAASDELDIKFICTAGDFSIGDRVYSVCALSVTDNGPGAGGNVSVAGWYMDVNNYGSYSGVQIGGDQDPVPGLTDVVMEQRRTPALVIQSGAATIQAKLASSQCTGYTPGCTITFKIGRVGVYKTTETTYF